MELPEARRLLGEMQVGMEVKRNVLELLDSDRPIVAPVAMSTQHLFVPYDSLTQSSGADFILANTKDGSLMPGVNFKSRTFQIWDQRVRQGLQQLAKLDNRVGRMKFYADDHWPSSRAVTVRQWLKSFSAIPPTFYHGTLDIHMDNIMKKGLMPRNMSKAGKGWGGDRRLRYKVKVKKPGDQLARWIKFTTEWETGDAVYLTANLGHAKRAAIGAQEKTKIHQKKTGLPVILQVKIPDVGRLYPDDDNEEPTWRESLRHRDASVAYRGRIPASHLEPILKYSQIGDEWLNYDEDVQLEVPDRVYKFASNYARNLIKRITNLSVKQVHKFINRRTIHRGIDTALEWYAKTADTTVLEMTKQWQAQVQVEWEIFDDEGNDLSPDIVFDTHLEWAEAVAVGMALDHIFGIKSGVYPGAAVSQKALQGHAQKLYTMHGLGHVKRWNWDFGFMERIGPPPVSARRV